MTTSEFAKKMWNETSKVLLRRRSSHFSHIYLKENFRLLLWKSSKHSVLKSFFKRLQFGPSALVSTQPIPPTKHPDHLLNTKFKNYLAITCIAIHWSSSWWIFRALFFDSEACMKWWQASRRLWGVCGRLALERRDLPTPNLMCDYRIFSDDFRSRDRDLVTEDLSHLVEVRSAISASFTLLSKSVLSDSSWLRCLFSWRTSCSLVRKSSLASDKLWSKTRRCIT